MFITVYGWKKLWHSAELDLDVWHFVYTVGLLSPPGVEEVNYFIFK